jgi:hypothetical protein
LTLNSSNFTNSYSYISYEDWLTILGSTIEVDILVFFFLPILSLIGFILNIISLRLLYYNQFRIIKLYSYLKLYLINSSLVTLVGIGNFLHSKRFIDFNSYFSSFYITYIYIYLSNMGYFYGCMLDIMLILEQIFILKNKVNILNKYSAYVYSGVLFVICLVINMPFFFAFVPASLTVDLSSTLNYTFYYVNYSYFATTQIGSIILLIVYVLRDITTLILQAVCSIWLIIDLKKYLAKKSTLVKKRVTIVIDSKQTLSRENPVMNTTSSTRLSVTKSALKPKGNKADVNATLMVITISILSILEHLSILLILGSLQLGISLDPVVNILPNITIRLKHSSNFFILLLFNKNFKDALKKFLSCYH